jgi:hypothetical protein
MRRVGMLAAAAAVMVACGSDAKKSDDASGDASNDTTAAAPAETSPVDVNVTAAAPSGDGGGSGGQLPAGDANYTTGRVHVEFGGDSGGAAEIDGTGAVIGGFVSLVFSDETRQASVTFAVQNGQGGAAFTWDGITSGGEFGKECTINFTKGDQSELTGEFTCTDMVGVKATSVDTQSVDARGTFTMMSAG